MVSLGLLHEDEHVQLIEGEILEMTPQYPPHATAVQLVIRAIAPAFGGGYTERPQLPLALSDDSEPEPDVAVVSGDVRDFVTDHPTTASLVVEVADSSLAFDRRKARIYAAAGIPEYWIVNLGERVLEVYREPRPADLTSAAYTDHRVLGDGETLSPVARPDARIAVADLLP